MELSELESFHFLFQSIWNQDDDRGERHKMNIMDTIIYLHGFPVRWLFTSEKTGEVLRKTSVKPKDIMASLKSRAIKLKTTNKTNAKVMKKTVEKGAYFAVIWYKTESGQMEFCKIDEYHLFHVLNERIFTQAIVAVQVYFDPTPFKGCGFFEHHFNSQTHLNVGAHKTIELTEFPPSSDYFEMHERIVEQGTYEEFTQSQSQSHMILRPDIKKNASSREGIHIRETQYDLIKVSVSKLVKLMEGLVGGSVLRATFIFYFNENWSPFVVATRSVVTQASASTDRILMYNTGVALLHEADSRPSSPYSGQNRKLVKGVSSLKVLSKHHSLFGAAGRNNSSADTDSTSDSDESDQQERHSRFIARTQPPPIVRMDRRSTILVKKVQDDPNFIPPVQPGLPPSTTQYDKTECSPEKRPSRRVGIATRSSALQKILSDARNNDTAMQFADTSERVGINVVTRKKAKSIKSYMIQTEQWSQKLRQHKEDICGKDTTDLSNRRPITAPHAGHLDVNDPFAAADLVDGKFRGTGVDKTQMKKTFRKKLMHQKDFCFGDYCGLLSKYLDEWEIDDSLVKVKDANGVEKLKSSITVEQISTKSIYLCRSEVAYAGYDIALQANLEGLGHDKTRILTACATNHISNVSDKCRKEALVPILTMAELNAKRGIPTMRELLISSFVYRNMVYNDALAKVHPSRFYYTAPVCSVCKDIYTAMDEARANIIYKKHRIPANVGVEASDSMDQDSSTSFEERIAQARRNLKKQADRRRKAEKERQALEEENDESNKKSLDSSKIHWESKFLFEMNALQRGDVVEAPLSVEESMFLDDTDPLPDENHKDPDQIAHKEHVPQTNIMSQTVPLKERQESMTALLNPTLGRTAEIKTTDLHEGMLKSKSQNAIKPSSATFASNTFSSWASLLDKAHSKGHRRRAKKDTQLRKTYKNNPEVEEKRKKLLEARRLERHQNDLWLSSLKNPNIDLGGSPPKRKSAARRPRSAPAKRVNKITKVPPPPIMQYDVENDMVHHTTSSTQICESPLRGNNFELETEEDVKEFNDIKVNILKNRGLHSIPVKRTTKVLCNGEFARVVMATPAAYNEAYVDPHAMLDDKVTDKDKDNIRGNEEGSASTSNFLQADSSIYNSQPSPPSRMLPHYEITSHQHGDAQDGVKFVSALLKNSPISPQNIDYDAMQNTQVSNEVKKLIEEFDVS